MGFDSDVEPSPTPKLSLFSLPSKPHMSPGLSTPPIHTSASVPFKWEEAPGKPRACTNHHNENQSKCKTAARCLELPPRLLNGAKVNNMPSPTAVFDGPYMGLSRSFSSLEDSGRRGKTLRTSVIFGSRRWGSFARNKELVGYSVDFSCQVSDGGSDHDGVNTKVRITRVKRKSSFLGFSSTRSHLWTNIYEGFKQVVPWKLRQRN